MICMSLICKLEPLYQVRNPTKHFTLATFLLKTHNAGPQVANGLLTAQIVDTAKPDVKYRKIQH